MNRRDIEDTIWQVLISFGFCEEDGFSEKKRYFILDKKEAAIVTGATEKARAEAVSACIEAAFAIGIDNFSVKVSNKEVFNLLSLFGFENILSLDITETNGFNLVSDDTAFAEGTFEELKTVSRIDIDKLFALCGNDGNGQEVSKSLVFAERDAEGVAYDICYTLRINGCIVEMYCEGDDINAATGYAEEENASAIVRCYPDGCVEIKDMVKNEIIKTTLSDFLGYYEDDCDCGHEHHGEDCDCGHHHH